MANPCFRILQPPSLARNATEPLSVSSSAASSEIVKWWVSDGDFLRTEARSEKLGIPELKVQLLRRTMTTLAQNMGSVNDIQAHLRHAKADTTAN